MIDNPIWEVLRSNSMFATIYYVLYIIGIWMVFKKAGETGWKSLIPIYNVYTMFMICWKTGMFWLMILLTVAGSILTALYSIIPVLSVFFLILAICCFIAVFVIHLLVMINLGRAFGKSTAFIIGLIILSPIFIVILGLGSSHYIGARN